MLADAINTESSCSSPLIFSIVEQFKTIVIYIYLSSYTFQRALHTYLGYVIWSVEIDTKLTEIKKNKARLDAERLVVSFPVE